jgi:Uma2 family endonuclease
MTANPKKIYSLDEYFTLDRESDIRYEFWNGEVSAIPDAQPDQNRISRNIIQSLSNQLEMGTSEVFDSDQRVKVNVGSPYLYPDVSVACPAPEFETIGGLLTLVNPCLIIETLSSTAAKDDKKLKFTQYQSIFTLHEYLLIESEKVAITYYKRQPDQSWLPSTTDDLETRLKLESIDCALTLREIYSKVDFLKNAK